MDLRVSVAQELLALARAGKLEAELGLTVGWMRRLVSI